MTKQFKLLLLTLLDPLSARRGSKAESLTQVCAAAAESLQDAPPTDAGAGAGWTVQLKGGRTALQHSAATIFNYRISKLII
jgi:hypothetical protein